MLDSGSRQPGAASGRSQLATELLLTGYAVVSAIILLRTVLVILDVTNRVWLGSFIYGITKPVTRILNHVPGADRIVLQGLSLADLTLLAPVLLFPLGLIATGGWGRSR
jgi:hypothetical protein